MHKFCNILTVFEPFSLGLNFLSGAVHDEDETAFTKGELEEALKEASDEIASLKKRASEREGEAVELVIKQLL